MKKLLPFLMIAFLVLSSACRETEYVHVGENWAAVNELGPPEKSFSVDVSAQKDLRLGQDLQFQIRSQKAGKLWVVQVSPDDSLNVLFPNAREAENSIPANTLVRIPPREAGWVIEAGQPTGKSVLAFVVTVGDIELMDVLNQDRDLTKALRLVDKAPVWGLDKVVINVKE